MSSNDEAVIATGDSFWDVGCYKRTVTRAEDGAKLCSEFMTLIQERAEIEKHYVKSLKAWSHKWNDSIAKGPEYGTMEATWQASLEEAESLADVHLGIKDKLLTDVQTSIKQWKGENYHKPMVGTYKEAKQLDDDFRKVTSTDS
ncbi:hypothetical protein NP493_521g01079 [Ridgeia piscesae]|uniref:F-BAR domain-containing protein n=1 Tax=Ridgeia piscesae TaxID=27915 RepID=A0AAD9KX30_RIDPI|nr:hypothetical protein NP493_521g01079 [Ridgeia piscesae]